MRPPALLNAVGQARCDATTFSAHRTELHHHEFPTMPTDARLTKEHRAGTTYLDEYGDQDK